MGLVKIEVRQRQGIALSGLFRVSGDHTEPVATARAETVVAEPRRAPSPRADAPTLRAEAPTLRATLPKVAPEDLEATTLVEFRGRVVLVRGVEGLENEGFPLGKQTTVVGRSARCDLTIPEPGISREHLRFEWDGDELVLVHLSQTNSTCVNRVPVKDRRVLKHGDMLLLADQVELRVELGESASSSAGVGDHATIPPVRRPQTAPPHVSDESEADTPPPSTLREIMEEKLERDRLIEEQFAVVGSFVDIDVVGSYKMKAEAQRPAHIIVSFERFRSFVGGVIKEFGGQVLNSNGDELMCFFDATHDAVRAASAILERLDEFHTGRSLVDRERGVAYSEVLDIAGHLQKAADVNSVFVSQATLDALPEGLPFEPAGTLAHEGIPMYRATAQIR
jgi:class 3 adenylate cyclase